MTLTKGDKERRKRYEKSAKALLILFNSPIGEEVVE